MTKRERTLVMTTIEEALLSLQTTFQKSLRTWAFCFRTLLPLFPSLMAFSLIGPLEPLKAASPSSCDGNGFGIFVAKAQSLASETGALAREQLSCPRADFREASLYWLGFYLHLTQQGQTFGQYLSLLPPPTGPEKIQLRFRAWNGDIDKLKTKVQNGEKGYFDDPEVALTLARAMMRAGLFKDGLQHYEIYLRQKDNDESAEAERLFAFIWAGEKQAARLQIAAMRRFAVSPYLRQALDRAEALLGPEEQASTEWLGSKGPWLRLKAYQEDDSRDFQRRGLGLSFRGSWEVGIDAFESRHPLDARPVNQASLALGKSFQTQHWYGRARVGYFSVGPHNFTGRLETEWTPIDSLLFGVGAQREAIALIDKPLVGGRRGIMRDTADLLFGFQRRLIVKASFNEDDERSRFEHYDAELRLGSLLTQEGEQGYGFFIPLSYQHRPLPSPDLLTFPKEARTGLGLRLALGDGSAFRLGTEALVETVFRSFYVEPDDFEQLLSASLRADLRYYTSSTFCYFGAAELQLTEANPFESQNERSSSITIGIALRETPTPQ